MACTQRGSICDSNFLGVNMMFLKLLGYSVIKPV